MDYSSIGRQLKAKAKAGGNFVDVSFKDVYDLLQTLSFFFYRKKHEWIAVCFLSADLSCRSIWFNKGPSHREVTPKLSPEEVAERASSLGSRYVIMAHNHPLSSKEIPDLGSRRANIQASYEFREAQFGLSDQDYVSMAIYEDVLAEDNIGIAEAVYVAGDYYIEGSSPIIRNFETAKSRATGWFGQGQQHPRQQARRETGDDCFVVTFCFGRDSQEYADMIAFRDHILQRSFLGRMWVRLYYTISPRIVEVAERKPVIAKLLRGFAVNVALPMARHLCSARLERSR